MKEEEIKNLIKYRLEQAETSLGDARFLLFRKDSGQAGMTNYPGLMSLCNSDFHKARYTAFKVTEASS